MDIKKIISSAALVLAAVSASSAADVREYDVAVFGAGTGGMAAAIQAARCGARVAVIEATDRVGGQITASAVATMDDVGRTRTGIYRDFIDRVRAHYAATNTATNICLWGSDTIAVEPIVAERILRGLFAEAGGCDLYTTARAERAEMSGDALRAIEVSFADGSHGDVLISADVFIDATEHGDLLPLCGAEYRVGPGNVQDITYVAVVKRYQNGLPDELRLPHAPPRYEEHAARFREVVSAGGSRWGLGGAAPFDVPSHNAYRALPDASNPCAIDGGDPSTWPMITRTCVNWANDFPGRGKDRPGLTTAYIEDADVRRAIEREAMNKTLCFLWYMQNELGMSDWSVDTEQGYGWSSNDWESADDPLLPAEFAPVLKHFPPMPYVREGRRAIGVETLAERDIRRDKEMKRTPHGCPTSIALGEYPIDVHGSHESRYLEAELGESASSFPAGWDGDLGLFGVPYGVLVPIRVDGLIAAEKNISVSRMANGAVRLHPITMHTGQAAGAAAAIASSSRLRPRDVDVRDVQRVLIDAGQPVALDTADDVSPADPWWGGVQMASLTESFARIRFSRSLFGATLPVDRADVVRLASALGLDAFPSDGGRFVTRDEFASYARTAEVRGGSSLLERGEAAAALYEMSRREVKWP